MKKLFLMAAMMVATVAASAQVYVGGGVNFSSLKPSHAKDMKVDTRTSFGIAPEIGYKLDDKLSVGMYLGYNHSKEGNVKTDAFDIKPYARYTFVKWDKVGLFAQASFKYTYKKDTDEYNDVDEKGKTITVKEEDKTTTWAVGIEPGISVDLTDKLTFISTIGWLGYSSSKPDGSGIKASSDFVFDVHTSDITFSLLFNF